MRSLFMLVLWYLIPVWLGTIIKNKTGYILTAEFGEGRLPEKVYFQDQRTNHARNP